MKRIVDRAVEIESGLTRPAKLDQLTSDPDPLFNLAVRIAGANIGAVGAVASTGAPFVAAGAGSQFLQKVLEKVPLTRTLDILLEAAENPPFAAALLRRGKSIKEKNEVFRQINAFLLQAGFVPDEE